MLRTVKHNKTGKLYLYIMEVKDSTNSENNKLMILYSNLEGELFVREKSEFWYKFSNIESNVATIKSVGD